MITRIEATKYRCFEKLDIDLQSFAVLVGANGAGKTTLLDIPGLVADCLKQQNVGQAFTLRQNNNPPRCTTLNELVFCNRGDYFIISLEAELPATVTEALLPTQKEIEKHYKEQWLKFIRYEIRFEIFNERELNIKNEYLFLFSENNKPERFDPEKNNVAPRLHGEINPDKNWRFILKRETGVNETLQVETKKRSKAKKIHVDAKMLALPRVKFESSEFPAASWFHDLLTQGAIFYQPDIDCLVTASPPGLSHNLMHNAANLPWLALELQKDNPERFDMWVEHVNTALQQVSSIEVKEREEDHHAYFIVTYNGGYKVSSSGLSEGTLRIIALTILPYLLKMPQIIIIEEPENGIHPRAIEAVLQSLSSVYDSQVLISSHSPVVLAQSELDQILCSRLGNDGSATVISGKKHPQLKDWQGKIDLGALFAAGVLG